VSTPLVPWLKRTTSLRVGWYPKSQASSLVLSHFRLLEKPKEAERLLLSNLERPRPLPSRPSPALRRMEMPWVPLPSLFRSCQALSPFQPFKLLLLAVLMSDGQTSSFPRLLAT
jgi:hypothetical protein